MGRPTQPEHNQAEAEFSQVGTTWPTHQGGPCPSKCCTNRPWTTRRHESHHAPPWKKSILSPWSLWANSHMAQNKYILNPSSLSLWAVSSQPIAPRQRPKHDPKVWSGQQGPDCLGQAQTHAIGWAVGPRAFWSTILLSTWCTLIFLFLIYFWK